MAQSTAPPKAVTLRNFSRRPRVPSVPPQQRLLPLDGMWMASFAVVNLILSYVTGGPSVFTQPQTYLAALTVVFLYVLGFRVRDRATAVIASALLASSPVFTATQIESVRSALFVLFTVLALAAYATAQYSTAAEMLAVFVAAAATIMRPEGFLLGAVLLGFAITDKRPGGIVGLAIYLIATFAGMAAMLVLTHRYFPAATVSLNAAPLLSLIDKQTVILSCFIIALLGDLAEPPRRKRLKAVIVWAALFVCAESLVHFTGFSFEAGPFRPILFLLAAAGIARILPVIAGDFPNPRLRYGIATLFVGILVADRVNAEWPVARKIVAEATATREAARRAAAIPAVVKKPIRIAMASPASGRPAAKPSTKPAKHLDAVPPGVIHHYAWVPAGALKSPISTVATASPVVMPALKPAVKPKLPFVPGVPPSLVAAAVAAGVPTYATRWGHTYPRTVWAITWDIDHHLGHPPTKPVIAKAKPKPKALAVLPKPKPALKPLPKPVVVAMAPPKIAPAKPKQVITARKPKPLARPAAKPAYPPGSLAARAAAAGVSMYRIENGQAVPRTMWAINWDIEHHLGHPGAKALVPRASTVRPTRIAARRAPRRYARPVHGVRRPGGVRRAKRRTPPRRHRSIWAVRWQRAHARRR